MCTNHTGIGSFPEAMYTGLRYPRSNSWNGTTGERTSDNRDWDDMMLDLLKDKPYMHSDAPGPAVEDPEPPTDDDSDDEDNDLAPPLIDDESENEDNDPPPLMGNDDSDDESNDNSGPDN